MNKLRGEMYIMQEIRKKRFSCFKILKIRTSVT